MQPMSVHGSFWRLASGMGIGIVLALGAAGPAFGTFHASSQLCYGADCSESGYGAPLSSVSDSLHRDVDTGVPNQTGSFDENATADVAARQVTFEVGFTGSELTPDAFLGSTPSRPYGSLTLLALLGAIAEDQLTITAPGLVDGFVSIDVALQAGGIDGCTAVGGCTTGLPFVAPRLLLQFFAQADSQGAGDAILRNAELAVPGGYFQEYASEQIGFLAGVPFSVRLGISGTMDLSALLDPDPPDLFLSGGTLGATATVMRVHVFDASHNPVANASISSASGADWTTTLPEPSGAASGLAAAPALWLLAAQRRIRANHALRDRLTV
jgi:hypothetical protein